MESEMSDAAGSASDFNIPQPEVYRHSRRRGRSGARGGSSRGGTSRGRARPSMRSRGRGHAHRASRSVSMEAVSQRRNMARDQVMVMDSKVVKEPMLMAADVYPSTVLDLIQRKDSPDGGYHPQPVTGGPSWCRCGHGREMPSDAEKLCCDKSPENCISRTPVVVLDEAVLRVSRLCRQDVLAVGEGEDLAKENRHAAYRKFTLWAHGCLGTGIRTAPPSCCVWAIRDRYPDPFGQYEGFLPSRLS